MKYPNVYKQCEWNTMKPSNNLNRNWWWWNNNLREGFDHR